MKSKDWSTIAVIAVFSAVVSFALFNFAIGSKKLGKLKVEKVVPLSSEFPLPNAKYFNSKSINPTQEIKIGEETNVSPFKKN